MSEEKEKTSYFSKPIEEITIENIDRMTRDDLAEYIIEHPWSQKGFRDEDRDALRTVWSYSSLMKWALRWCEEFSKRGAEQAMSVRK